jgi:hypothetical protein
MEDKKESNPIKRGVVYLDVEDDITGVIGKFSETAEDTVALVIPKRSNVFQSIVNLKLLQKTAAERGKTLNLISDDKRVITIANRLGIANAGSLAAVAAVGQEEAVADLPSDVIEEEALASGMLAVIKPKTAAGSEPVSNQPEIKESDSAEDPAENAAKKDKKLKVPDFNRFKKRLVLAGALLVVLLIGLWAFLSRLPKATVTIDGQTDKVATKFDFSVDPAAEAPNIEKGILPALSQEVTKTLSDTFTATGKKDIGKKASGTVTVTNCESSEPISIPSETNFIAENGLVFKNSAVVSVPGSSFVGGGTCLRNGKENVAVTAAESGEKYNIGPSNYTIEGEGFDSENVTGTGGNMEGGTTEIVSVISKQDVDNTVKTLLEREKEGVEAELRNKFEDSHFILGESFTQTVSDTSPEPKVGAQATQGRVIVKVTYFQLAVNKEDMINLLKNRAESAAASANKHGLGVVDPRLEQANISLIKNSNTRKFNLQTEAVLGPAIDFEALANDIAGLGYSEAIKHIEGLPNVTHAEVNLSPFWVSSVPKDPSRTSISINLPQ